jgi:hypothetical protein
MVEGLGPSPSEMGLGPKDMATGADESESIESPELAEVLAEEESRMRNNIEDAKKEGGKRGSEENIRYLEAGMKTSLERREEEYRMAMEIADKVVDNAMKANKFGWNFELSGEYSVKALRAHERLKSGSHLTRVGRDVIRAIDYRTITKDENGRPIPKTIDVDGHPKMIVGMERLGNPDPVTRDAELFSINYKLVDAKPNTVPRTVQYPESRGTLRRSK